MLKFADYDIVFQEIPNEVTLAINIANCPNRCKNCHSPHLWDDIGKPLNETALDDLLEKYSKSITCVAFMGGDCDCNEVVRLANYVRATYNLKVAWYSGQEHLPENFPISAFQFIKLGAYCEALGGLKSRTTNQRLYKILSNGKMENITETFWK